MATVAVTTDKLIPELCRSFEHATGWRLTFTPADDRESELSGDPSHLADCCWWTEISNNAATVAYLHLEPSPSLEPCVDFTQVTMLAESLAQLLNRMAAASSLLHSRNRDVSTLVNLGMAVPAQDDLAWGLSQLLKAATHLTSSRSAAFFLLDSTASRLRLRAVYQIERDEIPQTQRDLRSSWADLKALADAPTVLTSVSPGHHPYLPEAMKTAVCVAVQSESAPIGTLWVFDRRIREYSERDMHVLESLAAQVAAVLERAALQRGSETHERLHRELKDASEIQPHLTPDHLPSDPRYEIAAHCTSCFELGGDLCDVLRISDNRVGIAVGDASGNSVPAAMIMSAVRGALRAHPADEHEVVLWMQRVNNALCEITGSHQFMSLCYGVYDAERRTFTYSNAGHPTPLVVRRGEIVPLDSHGLLLGVVPDTTYRYSVLELHPGDLLVMYSDGISEARNRAQQLFRWEGISAAVAERAAAPASEVLQGVWDEVDRHIAGGSPGDDRTLLVLRVH
jgi:phosphoserine phosphatase RsbU/P